MKKTALILLFCCSVTAVYYITRTPSSEQVFTEPSTGFSLSATKKQAPEKQIISAKIHKTSSYRDKNNVEPDQEIRQTIQKGEQLLQDVTGTLNKLKENSEEIEDLDQQLASLEAESKEYLEKNNQKYGFDTEQEEQQFELMQYVPPANEEIEQLQQENEKLTEQMEQIDQQFRDLVEDIQ